MRLGFRLGYWFLLVLIGWYLGGRLGAPDWLIASGDGAVEFVREVATDSAGDESIDTDDSNGLETSEADTESGAAGVNAGMRTNAAAIDIIKQSEGLRLEAYTLGGRQYIGYGHQMQPGEKSVISEAEAEALLRKDLRLFEDGVAARLTRPANSNEFSAMVSLAYNLGLGNFSKSQVLAKFNEGDKQGAADAFRNHNRGGGKVIEKLTQRREKERALFLTPA